MAAFAPVLALLAAMASFQLGATLAKELFAIYGAEATAALRLGLGALMLIVMHRAWKARLDRGNWRALSGYGMALGGMNLMYYLAVGRLPLGIASAIAFLGPLTVAVICSRRRRDLICAAIAAAGLVLLTAPGVMSPGGSGAALDPVGVGWALGNAACWAIYIVLGKRAGQQHGARGTALGMSVAALMVLPLGIQAAPEISFDPALAPLILGMTILSTTLPFTLEMYALRTLPSRTLGTLMSLEPAIGAVVGLCVLGERLTRLQIMAVCLIVLASAAAALSSRTPPQAAAGTSGAEAD